MAYSKLDMKQSDGIPHGQLSSEPNTIIVVGMGEMRTTNDRSAELVTYSLGSCVGLTVYDPVRKVGGMLHAMLPDSTLNSKRAASQPHHFVDTALPPLFHAIYAAGGLKENLVVKLAGGGEFLDEKKLFNIGLKNVTAVRTILARNNVRISAADTGGHFSRTLRLDISTGIVTLETPGKKPIQL
jgi:chemotaxis protein CheD